MNVVFNGNGVRESTVWLWEVAFTTFVSPLKQPRPHALIHRRECFVSHGRVLHRTGR